MSQTTTAERVPPAEDPFRMDFSGQKPADRPLVVPTGAMVGAAADQALAQVITAQRVAIKRDFARVKAEAVALAAVMGPKAFYEWPVPNRKTGTTSWVRGLTIKGAMAAVNLYGNCKVECFPAQETPTHWTFMARFSDYETGTTVVRAFQQRKGQTAGKMDADRMMDIAFQIGQSKGIRNVVVASLAWLCDEMLDAAMEGFVEKVKKGFENYKARALAWFQEREIDIERVVRQVARPVDRWRVQDLAQLITKIQQVNDGMEDAEDLWPSGAEEEGEELDAGHGGDKPQQQQTDDGGPSKEGAKPEAGKRTRGPNKPKPPPAEDALINRIDGGRTDLDPKREEPPHDQDGVIDDKTPPNTGGDGKKAATGSLDFD